jgi:hypothetical protein
MKDLTKEDRYQGPSLYLRFLRLIEKISKKKFWLRLGLYLLIGFGLYIIFFPAHAGDTIGTWYHNLTESFSNANK